MRVSLALSKKRYFGGRESQIFNPKTLTSVRKVLQPKVFLDNARSFLIHLVLLACVRVHNDHCYRILKVQLVDQQETVKPYRIVHAIGSVCRLWSEKRLHLFAQLLQ